MPFEIVITDLTVEELLQVKKFYRVQIIEAIDSQLTHEPMVETKNRKILIGVEPEFEHVPPVWEIRIGEYRVFCDVNEELNRVLVRAVRKKPPHATTEQVI